ncbi:MAG: SRPBCC family protein [Flavobacteriaceae bacterium]|jgi:ligand-binding SRPBCC domain-containing protein|nr:SRPBCC family protein [Flavobacteriaceae bacterium]
MPISVSKAWIFFSSPENLAKITPPKMNFLITSGKPKALYTGQIISYKVNVVKCIQINWVTEITCVDFEKYFVDEQRFGPYKMWHHEHIFEKIDDNNCKIIDVVSYKLPFGIIGKWGHKLFVKKQLQSIFEYRTKIIKKLFIM